MFLEMPHISNEEEKLEMERHGFLVHWLRVLSEAWVSTIFERPCKRLFTTKVMPLKKIAGNLLFLSTLG